MGYAGANDAEGERPVARGSAGRDPAPACPTEPTTPATAGSAAHPTGSRGDRPRAIPTRQPNGHRARTRRLGRLLSGFEPGGELEEESPDGDDRPIGRAEVVHFAAADRPVLVLLDREVPGAETFDAGGVDVPLAL
jgi:hypothetical protein